MVAGVFTTVIMTPGERIKCLLQVSHVTCVAMSCDMSCDQIQQVSKSEAKYSGSIDCAKQLLKEGGVRSLYRGTMATLLRGIKGCGYGSVVMIGDKLYHINIIMRRNWEMKLLHV